MFSITVYPEYNGLSPGVYVRSKTGRHYAVVGMSVENHSTGNIIPDDEFEIAYIPLEMNGKVKRIVVDGKTLLEGRFDTKMPFADCTVCLLMRSLPTDPYQRFNSSDPSLPPLPRS